MRHLAMLALLAGCTVEMVSGCAPVQFVPVYTEDHSMEAEFIIGEAASILGLQPRYQDSPYGALSIELVAVSEDAALAGLTLDRHGPTRSAWADEAQASVVAHEMAHMLGVMHACCGGPAGCKYSAEIRSCAEEDKERLMHPEAWGGTYVTPGEQETIDMGVRLLDAWSPR